MPNQIRKEDVSDTDFVDAYELRSDGYGINSIYLSGVTVVSTTSGTNTVVVNLAPDGGGIFYSHDHPVEVLDIVYLSGTSGSLADGYFTVNTIVSDTSFTVVEPIATSTGGTAEFRYPPGASKIGFNPTGLSNTDSNDVQEAIEDLDVNLLNPARHQTLRQLIHFIDEGPADGFASGAYKTVNPPGSLLPTSIIWYSDNTLSKKIVEQIILWTGIVPSTITWMVYKEDGTTVEHTVSDSITYIQNIFEITRTRTIT